MIQNKKVVHAKNKRVKGKTFEGCDLFQKIVLPIGFKDRELGKWYPN